MKDAIQDVISQFNRTKKELMVQRSTWHTLMVKAEQSGNAPLAKMAKRNRDLMHDRVMDFCSRADISITQLNNY